MEDSKYIVLIEKLSEIGERTARIEAKQDHMDKRLAFIEQEDINQNKLLAEHIEGTVQNREALKNETARREALSEAHHKLKSRVDSLETPRKVKKFLADSVMWIALVSGGIAAVLLLFKK